MDKDRELLPWIVGGLLVVTVAVAIAVHSTDGISPGSSQAVSQAGDRASAAPIPTAASAPAPDEPAPPAAPPSQVAAANLPPAVPRSQIWECRINGLRAFSSSPCGGESSVRQIGPINGMDSTPIVQQARSYEPDSSYRGAYPYPNEPQDSNPDESADNSYPVFAALPLQEHRRPDHAHRPHGRRPPSH